MSIYREKDGEMSRDYEVTGHITRIETARAIVDFVPTRLFGVTVFIDGELQFSAKDEYIYHEMLVHPAMMGAGARTNVCIIGGGDGLAAREVFRWRDVQHLDLIDWDVEFVNSVMEDDMYDLNELNIHSLHNDGLFVHAEDIRTIIQENRRYNCILVDLVDPSLRDGEQINMWIDILGGVRRWLAPGGSVVINAGGILPWSTETVTWLLNNCKSSFQDLESYIIQLYKVFVPSFGKEWCYILICPRQILPTIGDANRVGIQGLRYFNRDAWNNACTWTRDYNETLPVRAVNLN